jgi:hypothetical protein
VPPPFDGFTLNDFFYCWTWKLRIRLTFNHNTKFPKMLAVAGKALRPPWPGR